MQNLFMGLSVSGVMMAVVFSITWIVQKILKKSSTVSVTGLKFSAILFLVGFLLSVGIGFTIVLALIASVLYFTLKKKKVSDDSAQKPKRSFWNIPFRSEPKAVAIAAAISLCITVWATVDFYRTADTITTDSPSAAVEIEEEKAAEEAAAKEAEQKAAEEAAAKEAEQKAAEEAAAKEAEQKAAEEAAAKEAEQKAAEEAAAKEAEQKAAEEAAAIEAEQKAAEEAAAIEAEQKAAEEAAQAAEQDTEEYVLNTNTKKFHHSWCSSANRIKPGNRSTCVGRDTAIAMGYTSCGQCNP